MNENKRAIPPETKQDSGISRRNNKHSEKLDLEGPSNPVDKKTARWIEQQNEFLGNKRKRDLIGIRRKGMRPNLVQMVQLKSYSGQELPTIPIMSSHPSI